ncbi:hypothetical protein ACFTAO_10640 [Paenibacillus rhizoplanae]
MEPELILLDEPTSYLDPLSETQMLKGLEAIHDKGTTVVMATHDMDLAYRWADWIIVLEHGRCRAAGTPEEIFLRDGRSYCPLVWDYRCWLTYGSACLPA